MAEKAATGITEQLVSLGFESDRLKTGTPPRIDGRSLDYSKMEEQAGDDEVTGFSYLETEKPKEQRSCWITYTNDAVHDMLKTGFDKSPMFQGRIQGTGPRYAVAARPGFGRAGLGGPDDRVACRRGGLERVVEGGATAEDRVGIVVLLAVIDHADLAALLYLQGLTVPPT